MPAAARIGFFRRALKGAAGSRRPRDAGAGPAVVR